MNNGDRERDRERDNLKYDGLGLSHLLGKFAGIA